MLTVAYAVDEPDGHTSVHLDAGHARDYAARRAGVLRALVDRRDAEQELQILRDEIGRLVEALVVKGLA